MSYQFRTVRLSQWSDLRRLAAEGICVRQAASTVGLPKQYVWEWARDNRVHFAPPRGRGTPDWLVPELARQAEDALRATWAAVMGLGREAELARLEADALRATWAAAMQLGRMA